jgi:methyl-accepting chemotaxis protein
LGEALNDCVGALRDLVKSVAQSAETLSSATTEISASNRGAMRHLQEWG